MIPGSIWKRACYNFVNHQALYTKCMHVKKYNLYNITSLYVIQVSDSQGIFIDYNVEECKTLLLSKSQENC
jgi:hypothetical protein